jgi:NAD(P)-dependent dehydrogenase (short-subunit alcohol dehydrogenase family)
VTDLQGKVALVTGSASGIGRATALLLGRAGASVAVVDKADGANVVAKQIEADGGTAIAVITDVADPDQITRCVNRVMERFGRIDILVNDAGVTTDALLLDESLEEWDLMHAVNVRAPFLFMKLIAKQMVERGEGGKIVNVSSSSAFRGARTNAAYASSKAGVAALTRSAAAELGPHGINVNSVAPGLTRTGMTEPYIGGDEAFTAAVSTGPLANFLLRHSEPEDVANVIVFLCTDAARQVTGQTLHTSAGAVV